MTIRVINATNGHPLEKQHISVVLHYEKGEPTPPKYDPALHLETDAKGEAQFKLPAPPPVHFLAQVNMDWARWRCGCGVLASTIDVIQKGVAGPFPHLQSKKTISINVIPGKILFVARPLSFFERLLYPFVKG